MICAALRASSERTNAVLFKTRRKTVRELNDRYPLASIVWKEVGPGGENGVIRGI